MRANGIFEELWGFLARDVLRKSARFTCLRNDNRALQTTAMPSSQMTHRRITFSVAACPPLMMLMCQAHWRINSVA